MGDEVGIVSDLWRFPVKSFGGERLRRAFVGPAGILGDRRHAVLDPVAGAALSARRVSALLGYAARSGDPDTGGSVVVTTPDGVEMSPGDPTLSLDLTSRLGRRVQMARSPGAVHDCAPMHIVSEASLAAAGSWVDGEIDRRRFRANVVVELSGPGPYGESDWPGHRVALGDEVVLGVVSPTERCAVTTYDPDTLERDTRVLAGIARDRENLFGVYAEVVTTGWVAVGDAVRLVSA